MDIGPLSAHIPARFAFRDRLLLNEEDRERATYYRATARKLRDLAAAVRFDFRRRQQLLALADGFDRAADRVEASAAAEN